MTKSSSSGDSDEDRTGPTRLKWLSGLIAVCVAAGFVSFLTIWKRPDLVVNSSFLFRDEGVSLYVIGRLLRGEQLYRDVEYQYGPVGAYLYVGYAKLAGNSVFAYVAWFAVLTTAFLGLVYCWLTRFVSVSTALLVSFGLFSCTVTPGATIGGYLSNPYIPLERLCLLGFCALWTDPRHRTVRWGVLMGGLLGVWQCLKFGGAPIAFGTLLLLDATVLYLTRASASAVRGWLASVGLVAILLAMLYGSFAVWAAHELPRPLAWDTVFPLYIARAYQFLYSIGVPRLPYLGNLATDVGRLSGPFVGAGFALAGFAVAVRDFLAERSERALAPIGLFVGLAFYLLSCPFLLRHEYLFYQYAWLAVVPAAFVIDRFGRRGRLVGVAMAAPCLLFMLKIVAVNPPMEGSRAFDLPKGDRLLVSKEEGRRLDELARAFGPPADRSRFLFIGRDGVFPAGFLYQYGLGPELRTCWFMPGFVRPYDEAEIERTLPALHGVVLMGTGSEPVESPCAALPGLFSKRFCDELESKTVGTSTEVTEQDAMLALGP